MSRPTIADVARTAGVSKATVSRVLNGTGTHMRAETAAKVHKAVKELGFRPNALARSLSLRRSGTLALVLSDVVNPFYGEIIHGLEDAALNEGANVFVCNTNYDLKRGLKLIRSLIDKQVDGVLLMSSSMEAQWLEELQANHVPTVVLDPVSKDAKAGVATITVDFNTGIHQAVHAFSQAGRKRLGILTGPLNLKTVQVRVEAFLNAAQQHGYARETITQVESNFRIEGGRQSFQTFQEANVDAVFSCNDLMALGLLFEARKQGVNVPESLAIIGLDNIELAAESVPSLSTVALPRYQIGQLASQLIFELLENKNRSLRKSIQTIFIARESS